MNVLDQMLKKYNLGAEEDKTQAMREVMQEMALAGLQRGGFFEKAAFYGGHASEFSRVSQGFLKT